MRPDKKAWLATLALLPLGLTAAGAARAATLNLTDTITYPGPTPPGVTVTTTGLSNAPITPSATFSLGDTLGAGLQNIPAGFVNGTGGPWNFYDDFVFSTTPATVDAAVISIPLAGLGVSHLQARIFNAAGNPAPSLANVVGGTLVDAWANTSCGPASCVITLPTDFTSGTYVLQIRGLAASGGGSYGGTVSFQSPVPLPAAAWLLISGLGGLGGLMRRRKSA